MGWLARFRRRRVDVGRYHAPPKLPQPLLDDMVADGVVIAEAAARLSLSNGILERVLRDGTALDDLVADGRAELLRLADECEQNAQHLRHESGRAVIKLSAPRHQSDYSVDDVEGLRRRIQVMDAVAARLRTMADDPAESRRIAETARDSALDAVMGAAGAAPRTHGPADDPAAVSRRRAMLALDLEDLRMSQSSY